MLSHKICDTKEKGHDVCEIDFRDQENLLNKFCKVITRVQVFFLPLLKGSLSSHALL